MSINDQHTQDGIKKLIEKANIKKTALHPEAPVRN
jgi:hypothetical protein